MATTTNSKSVVGRIGSAGKRTARGVGCVGMGVLNVLANAGDIQRRNEIREQLECIDNYDLEIAKEIIEERIARRR